MEGDCHLLLSSPFTGRAFTAVERASLRSPSTESQSNEMATTEREFTARVATGGLVAAKWRWTGAEARFSSGCFAAAVVIAATTGKNIAAGAASLAVQPAKAGAFASEPA